MSAISVAGDTSGSVTLQAPAVAGSTVLTLPAVSGTVALVVNAPAFSAYANADLSVASNVVTKVNINTEDFDTASCFDTTLYRFTPTVAGYYQVNGLVACTGATTLTQVNAYLYKNGASVLRSGVISATLSTGGQTQAILSTLIYMNGSTDYLELYGMLAGTGALAFAYFLPTNTSSFSAALVRSA